MKKTNAIRELDKERIPYKIIEYEVDENDVSAIAVSIRTGQDITNIFKTLVLLDEKKEMVIACIPGADNIDLKKLAKLVNTKKVEMIPMKDLFAMTGYVRGGCSPIGIKRKHRTYMHKSALSRDKILLSGGLKGIQVEINPKDLINYLNIIIGDIVV
ncbi:MAG: Cys-tRNA(Pro) deacylase [Fusobacteriaceae bacterium]|jgi:Cys-tRNA(Pro)/Cys-tRNA(Cys) deacylase|nr:Cys-tRNA(Pro) deacylase [Fusobacteriaceae bacterium]